MVVLTSAWPIHAWTWTIEAVVIDSHTELIGGRIVMDPPRRLHSVVVLNLASALRAWTKAGPRRGLVNIEQGLQLTRRDVLVPDILWWTDATNVDLHQGVQPVPDLAVEVRSRPLGSSTSASSGGCTRSTAWASCGSSPRTRKA